MAERIGLILYSEDGPVSYRNDGIAYTHKHRWCWPSLITTYHSGFMMGKGYVAELQPKQTRQVHGEARQV